MVKEKQVACITGTNSKNVLKHATLMAAIANKYTTTKTTTQLFVPTSAKMSLQP